MNPTLKPGTRLNHQWTGDQGRLEGPFKRHGEQWWTIFWQEAGTRAHKESEILTSMDILTK